MTDWLDEIEEAIRDKEPPCGWWPDDEQARRWLLNALDPHGIRLEEAEQDVKLITHAPAHIRRLIAKVRELEAERDALAAKLTSAQDRLKETETNLQGWIHEANALKTKLARVEELHTPQVGQGTKYCQECEGRWPCATITALKGNNQ